MASTSVTTNERHGDELLALLKSELTGAEQQLFVDGFHAYMKHDARKDFTVSLDDVYEWLGFTRKDNAKRLVHKHLTEGVHFTTEVSAFLRSEECTGDTLDRTQTVVMTVHGFKQLCMVANTDKSRRIRDYYIAMEEVMFEYTKRKMEESQIVMEQAIADKVRMTQQIEAAEAELVHLKTKTYEEIPKLDNVYVCKEAAQVGTDVHKIGKAINPKVREATFNTGSAQGVRMIYTRPTHNAKLVEDVARDVMKRYHIGGQGGTEHYNNNTDHSIDVIDIACVMTDALASSFEYMKRSDLINTVIGKLQGELDGAREIEEDEEDLVSTEINTDTRYDCIDLVLRFMEALHLGGAYKSEILKVWGSELFREFLSWLVATNHPTTSWNATNFGRHVGDYVKKSGGGVVKTTDSAKRAVYCFNRAPLERYLKASGLLIGRGFEWVI